MHVVYMDVGFHCKAPMVVVVLVGEGGGVDFKQTGLQSGFKCSG